GMFEPVPLGLGAISVLLTLWLAHRMDVIDHEGHPIHMGPRALLYWPWLLWKIITSNVSVAFAIWRPRLKIQPQVFTTQASQPSEVGRTAYANSITLTPGTVTIAMAPDGTFTVHALTDAARRSVENRIMDRRCAAMEGGKSPTPPEAVRAEPTLDAPETTDTPPVPSGKEHP
ncbi:MAG: Na+/H+ antiporter subunit E, partial [Alphaproteobacteria bacterium]|nr:Na+/H+ antiporter subunit E [Alphaproteobacteria bacterium]